MKGKTAAEIAFALTEWPISNGLGWLTLCPVHGDKRPSLSICDGEDGRLLVHCFAGCDPLKVFRVLRETGLLDGSSAPRPAPSTISGMSFNRTELLDRLWRESQPAGPQSIVARYLAGRGIVFPSFPGDLHEHPSLPVYENGKPTSQKFPAMLVVIRNPEGRPAGLHITFLRPDGSGKADIPIQRKIIGITKGSTRSGAVRLMPPKDGTVGLGEGIESALSGSILTGIPGWACLSAGGIERAVLPKEIKRIFIFADRDSAGLKTARNACFRFRNEGRGCEILAPETSGWDFNDVLWGGRT